MCIGCNTHHIKINDSVSSTTVIPTDTILTIAKEKQIINGVLFYKGQPFSGVVVSYFDSANKYLQNIQSYFNGKEEGWMYTYFITGNKESKRYFHLGEKDSIHTGWWNDGSLRFEYHFSKGNYDGSFKEFYEASGNPLREVWYNNGFDSVGRGWRANGKLFMNYTHKNGRRYGLLNAQPCYTVKEGRGNYFEKDSLQ